MLCNKSDPKKYGFVLVLYFGILVLLNQKKVIPLSYHIQALFINKKDKYLYH